MPSIMRLALPVLAAVSAVYAQECSADEGNLVVQNSGDAQAISGCTTYTGNIEVKSDAPGPIAIDGIEVLEGDLIVKDNTQLARISGSDLVNITGTFEINVVERISSIEFPKLKNVGAILFVGLPGLHNLDFAAKINVAKEVRIENTELQSIEGIEIEDVERLIIVNNKFINEIELPIKNVGTELIIADNSNKIEISFPDLEVAANMTFRNCSSINLPALTEMNSTLNMGGNFFTSFIAPNFTTAGGAISFVSNVELTNVSFPKLERVTENFELANNTKLQRITGFPELAEIDGAFDVNGNVTEISMPKLDRVDGAFNFQSTGDIQKTCDDFFGPLADDGKIAGEFVCEGKLETPGSEGTRQESGNGNNNETKPGAASALNIPSYAIVLGLVAAYFL